MMTFEPISAGELATRTGRLGVVYGDAATGKAYTWDGASSKFTEVKNGAQYHSGAAVSGTATLTAAQVATGCLIFSGGAGTQTMPTGTLLGNELRAAAGTVFDFTVINVAGSGTCTIAAGANMIAGPAVVTGGDTLTVANSATQGIGLFRVVFHSATAAVLFRIG